MKTNLYKKIVMDSKNNYWVFHLEPSKKTINVTRSDNNRIYEDEISFEESVKAFDLDIDNKNNIYLVAISADKNIIYCRYDHEEWVKNLLYSFPKSNAVISRLKIISLGNELHLLYILSVPGSSSVLFHHHWSEKEWNGYKVADIPGSSKEIKYDINSSDQFDGLNLVLYKEGNLCLWKFSAGQWEKKIDNLCEKISCVKTVVLLGDQMVVEDEQGIYFAKNIYVGAKDVFINIVNSDSIAYGPVIVNRKKTLHIAWVVENRLYFRTSYDNGESWGRVRVYNHLLGRELEFYKFTSSYQTFSKVKRVVGTKMPQLHIPFIHRTMEQIRFPEKASEHVSRSRTDVKSSDIDQLIKRIQLLEKRQDRIIESFKFTDGIQEFEQKVKENIEGIKHEITLFKEQEASNSYKQFEGILKDLENRIEEDINEIKADIISLKEMIDTDKFRQLESILNDLENMKCKIPAMPSRVLTQNTMNKYLKSKK